MVRSINRGRRLLGPALLVLTASASAQQKKRLTRPIGEAEEARDVIKAMRSIEARTQSGLNVSEFSQEVGTLRIAANALDELLERRGEQALRTELSRALEPWQDAKEVWGACIRECRFKIIALAATDQVSSLLAANYLEKYPELNKREADGGVLMNENFGQNPGRIFYPLLLSQLFAIGGARGRALRGRLSQS